MVAKTHCEHKIVEPKGNLCLLIFLDVLIFVIVDQVVEEEQIVGVNVLATNLVCLTWLKFLLNWASSPQKEVIHKLLCKVRDDVIADEPVHDMADLVLTLFHVLLVVTLWSDSVRIMKDLDDLCNRLIFFLLTALKLLIEFFWTAVKHRKKNYFWP